MKRERWDDIVAMVKDQFTVESETKEAHPDIPDGIVESIVFTSPQGRMKLELTTKPLVLGTKAFGAKRIGSEQTVRYETSATEHTLTFRVYRDVNGEWEELKPDQSAFGG